MTGRGWPSGLLVLALAAQGALPASATQQSATEAKVPPVSRSRRSGLDSRVATLTKALALDAKQEAALRKVLQDQREQVERIWHDESMSAAIRVAATRKVSARTGDRIREFLSEDQRKKYDPPSPGDPGKTIGGANVEEWLNGGKKP